uniref:Uncharacterized protein n=1 Tax=Anguilla anguilla TaxID=7936 RepID=A0A0E9PXM5_ANGAN
MLLSRGTPIWVGYPAQIYNSRVPTGNKPTTIQLQAQLLTMGLYCTVVFGRMHL